MPFPPPCGTITQRVWLLAPPSTAPRFIPSNDALSTLSQHFSGFALCFDLLNSDKSWRASEIGPHRSSSRKDENPLLRVADVWYYRASHTDSRNGAQTQRGWSDKYGHQPPKLDKLPWRGNMPCVLQPPAPLACLQPERRVQPTPSIAIVRHNAPEFKFQTLQRSDQPTTQALPYVFCSSPTTPNIPFFHTDFYINKAIAYPLYTSSSIETNSIFNERAAIFSAL